MPGDCSIFPSKCLAVICKHKNDRNNNDIENLNITMKIFTKLQKEKEKKKLLCMFVMKLQTDTVICKCF